VISDGLYGFTPDDFTPRPARPADLVLMPRTTKQSSCTILNYNNGAILELPQYSLRDGIATYISGSSHTPAFNPAEPAELQLNVSLKTQSLVERLTPHVQSADARTLALFDIFKPALQPAQQPHLAAHVARSAHGK